MVFQWRSRYAGDWCNGFFVVFHWDTRWRRVRGSNVFDHCYPAIVIDTDLPDTLAPEPKLITPSPRSQTPGKIPRLVVVEEMIRRRSERKARPVVRYSPSDTMLVVPSTSRVHIKPRPILPQVPRSTKRDPSGHLRIGDHSVSVDGTLPDLIANDIMALPIAPYALLSILPYIRQTTDVITLNICGIPQ